MDFRFGSSSSQRSNTNSGAAQSSPMSMTRLRALPKGGSGSSRASRADERENRFFSIQVSERLRREANRFTARWGHSASITRARKQLVSHGFSRLQLNIDSNQQHLHMDLSLGLQRSRCHRQLLTQ